MIRHKAHRDPTPRDLRDERHQAELSGPVITYPAIEELLPYTRPTGFYVTVPERPGNGLYLSREAAEWLFARAPKLRIRFNHIERQLLITPDPDGPWSIAHVGRRKSSAGYSGGSIGGTALVRRLQERGVKPGRYQARVDGNALVVEVGKA